MSYNIAVDGPAGAGKSTIARRVAKKLGFVYVDTGAMFRAIGLYFIRQGIDAEKQDVISRDCGKADVSIVYEGGEQQVLLNGENVNGLIRTEEAGRMASVVAKNPQVRKTLANLQKKLAQSTDVIMDGRDIGTTVLPQADLKVYLTASVEERAKRRYLELIERGEKADLGQIEQDIIARDEQDMNREISPLKKAEDAIEVDCSDMSIDEVTSRIIELFEQVKK
ncbi:MAG: (d)CMP kinase [Clostridiales bacterium]|nr:(d)CMP kinase [Clostridiales bacterium]